MTPPTATVTPRIALQIELALTADKPDVALRAHQLDRATRHGLTGAEIDLARAGRSFDVCAAAAIGLALACGLDDPTIMGAAEAQAAHAGFDVAARAAIQAFARHLRQDRKTV